MPLLLIKLLNFRNRKCVFIYPDFSTLIVGEFRDNGILISGNMATIHSITNSKQSWLIKLKINDESGQVIKSDISTDNHFSWNPLTRDPYESKLVDICKSKIPNAGEGVFLKRNVTKGKVIAYFNGIRVKKSSAFSWNPFKKKSVFLIDFQDENGEDIFLDIPEKFIKSSQYNATSGHKV